MKQLVVKQVNGTSVEKNSLESTSKVFKQHNNNDSKQCSYIKSDGSRCRKVLIFNSYFYHAELYHCHLK